MYTRGSVLKSRPDRFGRKERLSNLLIATIIILAVAGLSSQSDYFKAASMIPKINELEDNFRRLFENTARRHHSNHKSTFQTCLEKKFESMKSAISVSNEFEGTTEEHMKTLVTRMMKIMDETHGYCHKVTPRDAKLFYNSNPYMHECVDDIIAGVNSIRVAVASRPTDSHGQIHLLDHPRSTFNTLGKAVDSCLAKFTIDDL